MKQVAAFALVCLAVELLAQYAVALSVAHPSPELFLPKGYDTNRAARIHAVLRAPEFKYLGGLTSLWQPEFATTLVYGGDAPTLNAFVAALRKVEGITVRLRFSRDLSKETGSALEAGTWWVRYSHTQPDTITVRINLASEELATGKLDLTLAR